MVIEKIDPYKKYGVYSMLVSAFIFLVGNTVAIILYPNYSFSGNFFSDLGIRGDTIIPETGEAVSGAKYPEIFNITLYLSGIFIIPFFLFAYRIVSDNKKSDIFLKLAAISGITLGPLLIGVGIYDVAGNFDKHVDFATNLMLMVGLTSLFWAIGVILLDKNSKYKSIKSWKLDPIFVVFIVFVSWVLVWGRPNVIILKDISYPVYQKMVALSFIPYFSVVGLRLLKLLNQ